MAPFDTSLAEERNFTQEEEQSHQPPPVMIAFETYLGEEHKLTQEALNTLSAKSPTFKALLHRDDGTLNTSIFINFDVLTIRVLVHTLMYDNVPIDMPAHAVVTSGKLRTISEDFGEFEGVQKAVRRYYESRYFNVFCTKP